MDVGLLSNTCLIVSQYQPPPIFCLQILPIKISHYNDFHLNVVFRIHTHNGKFIHYCISVICAGRSIYLLSCSFHYLVFKFVCSDRIFFSLNMAPKRKATDAGSSLSPLKKRNAVTAGIGRAAESESNGIGFGYYGRTDDREDVSKTVPVFLGS